MSRFGPIIGAAEGWEIIYTLRLGFTRDLCSLTKTVLRLSSSSFFGHSGLPVSLTIVPVLPSNEVVCPVVFDFSIFHFFHFLHRPCLFLLV